MNQRRGLKMSLNNPLNESAVDAMKSEGDIVIIEDNKHTANIINDSILSQAPITREEEKRGSSGMGQIAQGPNFSSAQVTTNNPVFSNLSLLT